MTGWQDLYAEQEHYQGLLREAEAERLLDQLQPDPSPRRSIVRPLLAAVKEWLMKLGQPSEESYES